MFLCVNVVPFGVPVEPDVCITQRISLSSLILINGALFMVLHWVSKETPSIYLQP